jgi:hypothetical protein
VGGVADLLAALARGVPSMPEAACKGREAEYDAARTDRYAVPAALQICASCPVLSRCADWASTLPRSQRIGVLGGIYTTQNLSRAKTNGHNTNEETMNKIPRLCAQCGSESGQFATDDLVICPRCSKANALKLAHCDTCNAQATGFDSDGQPVITHQSGCRDFAELKVNIINALDPPTR